MFKLSDISTQFTWCDNDFRATLLDDEEGIHFSFTYNKYAKVYELYLVKEYFSGSKSYFEWAIYDETLTKINNFNRDFQPIAEQKYRELSMMRDIEKILLKGEDDGKI